MDSSPQHLLSEPNKQNEQFSKIFKRPDCSYESHWGRFKVTRREFSQQYAHMYFVRLSEMRDKLKERAKQKWGTDVLMKTLAELHDTEGQLCCIIGTVFRKMELQPSILKEISATHHLIPHPPRVKYVGVADQLILEDQVQRVILTGDLPSRDLVTGVVMALLGRDRHNGCFHVEQYCFAGDQWESVERPLTVMETDQKYVLLVSGLNLGSSWCDQLSVELLVDYVTGQLGGWGDQCRTANIVRVIIAGNSITDQPLKSQEKKSDKPQYNTRNVDTETVEAVREWDSVLAQLASCVPVDLMPGSHDPSNHQLPQQPPHRCMFPLANKYETLTGVTNPFCASMDGVRFLGTSGQNIDDIFKFSSVNDRLAILENTFLWQHISPTSPDTLNCYPFKGDDPFIFEKIPDVYFAGNQPSFQYKYLSGENGQTTLLVTVPTFDLTHSAVLVNLSTLHCTELTFMTSLNSKPNPQLARQRRLEAELDVGVANEDNDQSILHHMMEMDDFDED